MTGIPTQFAIADLVLEARRAAGDPVPADADLPFFYLGAVGQQLGDFLPARTELGTAEPNSRVFAAWLPILRLLAGTPGTPGLYENLSTVRERLNWIRGLANQADLAAKLELINNKAKAEEIPGIITALTTQLATVSGLFAAFAGDVFTAGPSANASGVVFNSNQRWKFRLPSEWRPRDTLHDSHTGRFLQQLRTRANDSGDSQLRAYADGATIAYASAVCGNPFINGIVGGPHRNHWWRHRWISNYVDTWVWGYVEKRRKVRAGGAEIVFTAGGRVPNPLLRTWDNVCAAELQRRIEFGGIAAPVVFGSIAAATPLAPHLPTKLVDLWLASYNAAYGPPPPTAGVDAAGVQSAFSLTWLTLWMATSAEFLGCNPPDQINLPDACGPTPDWVGVDGSVLLPGGGGVVPPPAAPTGSPSVAEIASAIAAALLGIMNYAIGNVAAGAALIAGAIALLDDATPPDWNALRCHSEWVAVYLANFENTVRDLLVTAGLASPYTTQLAHNEIQFSPLGGGQVVPPTAALTTCRPVADQNYPRSVWAATTSNWTLYPSEPRETPRQMSYRTADVWPLDFVDGFTFAPSLPGAIPPFTATQNNPLAMRDATPMVLSDQEFNERMATVADGHGLDVRAFGNAVDVAQALLNADTTTTPYLDWDLDGDRGLGWPTWAWPAPASAPGQVIPEL
ncbi:hypothetical protein [Mycobacterium hubeiense]|uniref:hypothetical protein n=1 Tax=Mycobacterium hubeiense TaxID=1867256 RepID=UPI000C7EC756|nr:hypothetical protein [Mycobacterium sp. QGD 101]